MKHLGNLFRQFKKCFFCLLPIGIGILIGLLLGFIAVEKLLAILPFAVEKAAQIPIEEY